MGSLHLFVLDRDQRKSAECDLSDYYVQTMGIHDGWGLQVSYLSASVITVISLISVDSISVTVFADISLCLQIHQQQIQISTDGETSELV